MLLAPFLTANAAPLRDGPYISMSGDGAWTARWVEGEDTSPRIREERTAAGKGVEVPGVGAWPAFTVKLRKPATVDPDEVALKNGVPLFVIADTHGEFEIVAELLKRHRVIDAQLKWVFGKGHLAVLGDVFDRGPHHTEILWLLYKLEAEAARAGGGLHLVLGNHESLVLGGDERYLNAKYLKVRDVLQTSSYAALWNEGTVLGQWLRTKATVLKIGSYLCLHGGISRETVDRKLSLAQMNADVRAALGQGKPDGFVLGQAGPQWYRGYFPKEAREQRMTVATAEDVEAALAFYAVKAIFVGHTMVPTVTPLFSGRVIAVQVYPRRDEATGQPIMEGLLVKDGRFHRARIDGRLEALTP
jgi:Calcineurin-like phosphoesterase